MVRRITRRTAGHGLQLPARAVSEMRSELAVVADRVVDAIIADVPGYEGALSGPMGENIRTAVQLALGGFLSLASGRRGVDPRTPAAPSVEGAYQLGRGEARSGRSTDALLAAYRIGARVSWREMSATAVRSGMPAETVASFAELVFAYIDELSAASVAGHADEVTTAGRARQRLLERLAQHLLDDDTPVETVLDAAQRAEWEPPTTLTAVLVPDSQLRPVLSAVAASTLVVPEPPARPGADRESLVLVPDAHDHRRAALLRVLGDRGALAGPARPWLEVRASYDRAVRARDLGVALDTEAHLTALVLSADAAARADLRAQVLAPLGDLRPATAEKLVETLRSWLLHQGRREDVAEALFVHPQTVRYRMGQLREVYGERLEDPDFVLALTVALG